MTDAREKLRERLSETPDPRQQLKEQLNDPDAGDGTALGAFLINLEKSIVDSMLAIPSASGDFLAAGAAVAEGAIPGVIPGGEGFEFRRRLEEQKQKFPANLIRSIPITTANDVLAAGNAVTSFPVVPSREHLSTKFSNELERLEAEDLERSEDFPLASGAGRLGGTVASLLIAKRPLQGSIRRVEDRLATAVTATPAPGVARLADRVLRGPAASLAARGGFRAAETGLEAAFIEVLSDAENDPILAAGIAAGGQAVSSMSAQAIKGLFSGGLTKAGIKLGAAAFGTWSIWQMVKSVTPGGEDRILESIESGYDKVAYTVLLGALGSLAGGRLRDAKLAEDLPDFVEALTATPRVGVLTLISDFVDAPEEEQLLFGEVLERITNDPLYEGESEREKALVEQIRKTLNQDE